jgi:protocatechuate 3,4-dioxygenase beta subunit
VLSPEVTQGPYWVQGELVREDITDDQEGVPLTLDIQIIDVKTCEPVPEAFLEIWHCNSTGVYSGVVANGNGNANDTTNLDNTFHRGIQKSDEDGVVVFETQFPGHYTGRAVSIS